MECQTKLQLLKEEIYDKATRSLLLKQNKDVVIFLDRGLMDVKAYMSHQEFDEMLCHLELTPNMILKRYNAVFHLMSAAIEAPDFYTNSNNKIRKETLDEAVVLDKKTHHAWIDHENMMVIKGCKGMEDKIHSLIMHIERILNR